MKQILLLAFIFCSMSLSAQSLIVTTSGQPITGYDVTVTPNGVFYRSSESSEAQFLRIATDSVSLVRHSDGTIVNVADQSTTTSSTSQNTPVSDTPQTADPNDYLDHEYNKAMIAKYNTPAKIVFEKESDKKKDANHVAFQHYATEDSQFASKDLIVSYHFAVLVNGESDDVFKNKYVGYMWNGVELLEIQMVNIKLENRSDKKIYVDLANTFLIRDGVSEPYYIPSAVSSTSGVVSGTNVNLGGITRAAGVGGSVGTIAGAINVSNSKSTFTTNTTYSQRIIIIPPYSTHQLDGKSLIYDNTTGRNSFSAHDHKGENVYSRVNHIFFKPEYGFEKVGDTVEWGEENTPYKISNFLTYSPSADFANSYTLNSSLYIGKGIGKSSYSNYSLTYFMKSNKCKPAAINCAAEDNIITFFSTGWRND